MDEEQTPKTRSGTGHYGELGVSLGELKRLSGMDNGAPNSKQG